jgi:Fe-S cluster assembly scaffold protein SufB
MTPQSSLIEDLYRLTDSDPHELRDPDVAHLVIDQNRVLGMHAVPGLEVVPTELADGVSVVVNLHEGVVIAKPVHLCFGMYPQTGIQRIIMDVTIGRNASISIVAHCVFPFAVDVQHLMDARIRVGDGARYSYFERHIHSPKGGVRVYPKAVVEVGDHAYFKTEFELIKGRVGLIDIDYETVCGAYGVVDMTARVSGRADDIIKIKETSHLKGDYARGLLTSKIAVRDQARAEVFNKLTATGAFARGHVDCKEIVQDQGIATAVPIVEVHHPKARVTHEAAIGSVDSKQLETLMSRGLSEEEAVELIIDGLLR